MICKVIYIRRFRKVFLKRLSFFASGKIRARKFGHDTAGKLLPGNAPLFSSSSFYSIPVELPVCFDYILRKSN
jgi:hypothetical protein